MDLSTVLVVVLVVIATLALIGLAVIGYVMWRYQVPPRGIVAMFAALAYLVSPVDVLPEAILGPFGLADDAGVVGMTVFFVYRLIKARQILADRGVVLKRRSKPSNASGGPGPR